MKWNKQLWIAFLTTLSCSVQERVSTRGAARAVQSSDAATGHGETNKSASALTLSPLPSGHFLQDLGDSDRNYHPTGHLGPHQRLGFEWASPPEPYQRQEFTLAGAMPDHVLSWRINGGEWSEFVDGVIRLNPSEDGIYEVQVRATESGLLVGGYRFHFDRSGPRLFRATGLAGKDRIFSNEPLSNLECRQQGTDADCEDLDSSEPIEVTGQDWAGNETSTTL